MIVVIPAYQPDEKLIKLVQELKEKTDYKILVVDDGSSADRQPIFAELEKDCIVLHHDVNHGKGRAMKTAFRYIADKKAENDFQDGIITVDADGQHLLKDIIGVSEKLKENKDALVLGSRKFTGKVPAKSRCGNAITRFVFAISTGVRVYDTQTGLRAFSTDLLDKMLEIKGERYEYEINQLLNCTREKIPIKEVEIETVYINKNETSHFHPFRDSWRIYKMILAFIASSLISYVIDYALLLSLNALFSHIVGDAGGFQLFGKIIETELPALIIARIVSSAVNYLMNRTVVFESKSKGSVFRYYLLAVFILALNYVLLHFVKMIMPLWIAQILVQLVVYPVSFILQRKFVFGTRNKKEKNEK